MFRRPLALGLAAVFTVLLAAETAPAQFRNRFGGINTFPNVFAPAYFPGVYYPGYVGPGMGYNPYAYDPRFGQPSNTVFGNLPAGTKVYPQFPSMTPTPPGKSTVVELKFDKNAQPNNLPGGTIRDINNDKASANPSPTASAQGTKDKTDKTQPKPPAPTEAPAQIDVRVPNDAAIWVDGTKTNLTGPSRRFMSPALTPGKKFTYEVRAEWKEQGEVVRETQRVVVYAGAQVSVDFPSVAQSEKLGTPKPNQP